MEIFSVFIIFGIIIFLGFLGDFIFKKTKIPDVLWLILFGIAIKSLFSINLGSISPVIDIFTSIALVFILFEGAMNTNVKYLLKGVPKGSIITILNFISITIVITFVSHLFGMPVWQGALFGAMLGGTGSAVVIPLVTRMKLDKDNSLALVFESAFSDVFCIVSAITIINVIKLGTFDLAETINFMLASFSLGITFGVLSGFVWLACLPKLGEYSKSYIATIAFLFILYGFVEYLHASGAMAAFAFGIVLGNSQKVFSLIKREMDFPTITKRQFYAEISFFLKSFFFVYIGLMITFKSYMTALTALGIVILLFMIRPLVILPISRGIKQKQRAIFEVMIPQGMVAMILAQLAADSNIPYADTIISLVPPIIFISVVCVTLFVFLIEKDIFLGFSDVYRRIYIAFKNKIQKIKEKMQKRKERKEKQRLKKEERMMINIKKAKKKALYNKKSSKKHEKKFKTLEKERTNEMEMAAQKNEKRKKKKKRKEKSSSLNS